jgi:hypothetical protein
MSLSWLVQILNKWDAFTGNKFNANNGKKPALPAGKNSHFWQISEIFFLHGASHRMEPEHRIPDVLENKNSMNHTRSRIFA